MDIQKQGSNGDGVMRVDLLHVCISMSLTFLIINGFSNTISLVVY